MRKSCARIRFILFVTLCTVIEGKFRRQEGSDDYVDLPENPQNPPSDEWYVPGADFYPAFQNLTTLQNSSLEGFNGYLISSILLNETGNTTLNHDWNFTDDTKITLDNSTYVAASEREIEMFSNNTKPSNATDFEVESDKSTKSNDHNETADIDSSTLDNVTYLNATESTNESYSGTVNGEIDDASINSTIFSLMNGSLANTIKSNFTMPNASLNLTSWAESTFDNASAWGQVNATIDMSYRAAQEQESNSSLSKNASDGWLPSTSESAMYDGNNASFNEAFDHGPELAPDGNVTLAKTTSIGQVLQRPNATEWPEATPLPPLGPDGLPWPDGNVSDGDSGQDEGEYDGDWNDDSGGSDLVPAPFTTSLASADSDGRGGDSTTADEQAPGGGPERNATKGYSNGSSMQVLIAIGLAS